VQESIPEPPEGQTASPSEQQLSSEQPEQQEQEPSELPVVGSNDPSSDVVGDNAESAKVDPVVNEKGVKFEGNPPVESSTPSSEIEVRRPRTLSLLSECYSELLGYDRMASASSEESCSPYSKSFPIMVLSSQMLSCAIDYRALPYPRSAPDSTE